MHISEIISSHSLSTETPDACIWSFLEEDVPTVLRASRYPAVLEGLDAGR